ncbi:MAG: hypothetical protein ACOCQQ_01120 [Candidatus Nanoarchaeia archaeon]
MRQLVPQGASNKKARFGSLFFLSFLVLLIILLFVFKDPVSNFLNDSLVNKSIPFSSLSSDSAHSLQNKSVLQPVPQVESLDVYLSENATIHSKKFPYILRAQTDHLIISTQENISRHFYEKPRTIQYYDEPPTLRDFMMKNIDNELQKKHLLSVVSDIQSRSSNASQQARIAISFVQLIPYDLDSYNLNNLHGRFAYEVLHDAKGVCGEKSELLAFLLRELGFGVAIFNFEEENHQALGISCPAKYDYLDSGYCFVETTQPTIITSVPQNYVGVGNLTSTAEIIEIASGKSLAGVSEEYEDAKDLQFLQQKGPVLEKEEYDAWVLLVNKYGLKVSS